MAPADAPGGAPGAVARPAPPRDVAAAILFAADVGLSKFAPEQRPHSVEGIVCAGVRQLAKQEARTTGRVHKVAEGSKAAEAQHAAGALLRGARDEVADEVAKAARACGMLAEQ
jgi:hypothetical protein